MTFSSGKSRKTRDREALLVDEVSAVGAPPVAVAGGVDVRRHVELDELLVQRVPVLAAEIGRLVVALARIRVEQAADETVFRDAALELRQRGGDRFARRLGQAGDAGKPLRQHAAELRDVAVDALDPAVHDAARTLSVEHREGPRRDELYVGAGAIDGVEIAARLHQPKHLVVADGRRRRAVARAAREQQREPGVELGRSAEVAVNVDDHAKSFFKCEA